MTHLFDSLAIRDITFKNRIAVSPMCQYSSADGFANDWHLVHLGSRAVGGAALVIMEATAVEAIGRISPGDMGIWKDEHIEPLKTYYAVLFVKHDSVPGIQLAHAGRKASMSRPWEGDKALSESNGGWRPVMAPSDIAFSEDYIQPHALTVEEIQQTIQSFQAAAKRALEAGFQLVELHAAHGYLMHEFLSPLSNQRTDAYGGSFENHIRLICEVTTAVRQVWPEHLPLFVRISASDWAEGGWDIDESVQLAAKLKTLGVDLIDCSSGGLVSYAKIPAGPNYQVPFAERIRKDANIATGAVGIITEAHQANEIITSGQADMVLLARELLRDPYWPLHAAQALEVDTSWPVQYERAKRILGLCRKLN